MTFSKTFLKIALFASTLTGLAGCKDGNLFKEEKSGSLQTYENQAKQASFYVDSLSAVATPETVFDELGKPKVRSYNFTACIKDVSQRGVLFFQTWNLSDGKTTRTLKADQAGCIFWPEEISFDYWGPEKFFPMVRTLEAQAGQVGKREFTFWINPWAASVRYQAQNMVDIPVEQRATPDGGNVSFSGQVTTYQNTKLEKVRTTSADVRLTFMGQSLKNYEIDELLQLKVAHRYFIQISPRIARRAISDPNRLETPTQGRMKVLLLFFRDDGDLGESYSSNNYITHFEDYIDIDRDFSRTAKEAIFKFPDIKALAGRMRVLAKFEYAIKNPSPYLDTPAFEGFLEPLPGGNITLSKRILADGVDRLYADIKKSLAADKAKKGLQIFKERSPFTREISESDILTTLAPVWTMNNNQFFNSVEKSYLNNLLKSEPRSSQAKEEAPLSSRKQIWDKAFRWFENRRNHMALLRAIEPLYQRDFNVPVRHFQLPIESRLEIKTAKVEHFVEKINNRMPVLALEEKALGSIPESLSVTFTQSESESMAWNLNGALTGGLSASAGLGFDFLKFVTAPSSTNSSASGTGTGTGTGSSGASSGSAQSPLKPSAAGDANIKASISGGWSYGWTRNSARSVGYSKSVSLTSRKRSFLVDAQVKKCMIITVGSKKNWAPLQFSGDSKKEYPAVTAISNFVNTYLPIFNEFDNYLKELVKKGDKLLFGFDADKLESVGPITYYFCDAKPRRRILKESFYYIVDNVNTTDSWVDSKSFNERVFMAFVRGESKYGILRDAWVSGQASVMFQPLDPFANNSDGIPQSILERVNQDFPGVASAFPRYEAELLQKPKLTYETVTGRDKNGYIQPDYR